jgi:hypothetical protein
VSLKAQEGKQKILLIQSIHQELEVLQTEVKIELQIKFPKIPEVELLPQI